MKWNYRVVTWLWHNTITETDERLYGITEVYYDKDGTPESYIDIRAHDSRYNALHPWEAMSELLGTYQLIGQAFEKPHIDLDNFPNIYKNDDI